MIHNKKELIDIFNLSDECDIIYLPNGDYLERNADTEDITLWCFKKPKPIANLITWNKAIALYNSFKEK